MAPSVMPLRHRMVAMFVCCGAILGACGVLEATTCPAVAAGGEVRFSENIDRLRSKNSAQRLSASRSLLAAGKSATVEVMKALKAALSQTTSSGPGGRADALALELMNILVEFVGARSEGCGGVQGE